MTQVKSHQKITSSYQQQDIKLLHVQSVPITTKAVTSNPADGEGHSIQHYVIKFVSDLRQVGDFLRVLFY
jgi:hypothetical protein